MTEWDKTLKVADYVFSTYHKAPILFQIVSIEKRFITKDDLHYGCYADAKLGDEYSPIVKVLAIEDLSLKLNSKKKTRKITAILDCSYLIRADQDIILEQIDRLQQTLKLL